MRWFGRKSADVPPTFLSYVMPNERSLFPSGYQAQVKEVFLGNPVGQRAVRMVAGAVGALKIYAVEGNADAATLIGRSSLLEQAEGKPDSVACYTTNGWRFIAPFDGLELFDRSSGRNWRFSLGTWSFGVVKASEIHVNGVKILGDQRPSISDAHGGTTVDAEARDILAQILSALRSHGIIAQPG